MRKYVWVIGLCCLLSASKAGDKPARVQDIEQKFHAKFMRVEKANDATGKPSVYWSFMRQEPETKIKVMGFLVPVNATDLQVKDCISSAEYAFGWYEGAIVMLLNMQKAKQAAADPSASPSPTPEGDNRSFTVPDKPPATTYQ